MNNFRNLATLSENKALIARSLLNTTTRKEG